MANLEQLKQRLGELTDPYSGRPLAEHHAVGDLSEDGDGLRVRLQFGYALGDAEERMRSAVAAALAEAGHRQATIDIDTRILARKVQKDLSPIKGVRNIIPVASGKGGVGKSTVASNLALALHQLGARVGLLDADIYGPSQPRMMGVSGKPESDDGKTLNPKLGHGIPTMSIGYMVEEDTPMIWRGPMVTQALTQLLNDTNWGELDYLVLDLPPGTGDIQLTLAQRVPVAGALIVTTPQDISLLDARKALKMFEKVEVPVLGLIENMSTHICSNCGHEEPIFGAGGGAQMATDYAVPLLGSMPLDIRIRERGDGGEPIVVAAPDSDLADRYRDMARRMGAMLSLRPRNLNLNIPNIALES